MIFLTKLHIIEMLNMYSPDTDISRGRRSCVRDCDVCSHLQTAGGQAASQGFHFQELHGVLLFRLSHFSEENCGNVITFCVLHCSTLTPLPIY